MSQPYAFISPHARVDENNVKWVTITEFPEFEISESKVVKRKDSSSQLTVYGGVNEGFVYFYINKKSHPRSLELLYRQSFNVLNEPFIENETWAIVPGYVDLIASTEGRLANTKLLTVYVGADKQGYMVVNVKKKNQEKISKIPVHQLVAFAYLGEKPTHAHVVNHIDGNFHNNSPNNLRWSTNRIQNAEKSSKQKGSQKRKMDVDLEGFSGEIWKNVPDFMFDNIANHGIQASNMGRIKQTAVCNETENLDGYKQIAVAIQGKNFRRLVHRLVAAAFLPNPNNHPQVDHIDGNPGNNNVTNLQWISIADHAVKTSGKEVFQYDLDGNFIERYKSVNDAAAKLNLSVSSIARAARGERTHYNDFIFSFNMVNNTDEFEYIKRKKQKLAHISESKAKIDISVLSDKDYKQLNEQIMQATGTKQERADKCGVTREYVKSLDLGSAPMRIQRFTEIIMPPNDEQYKQILATKGRQMNPKILKYNCKGQFVAKFNTITEALASVTKCAEASLRKCCLLKLKTASNFVWRYDILTN